MGFQLRKCVDQYALGGPEAPIPVKEANTLFLVGHRGRQDLTLPTGTGWTKLGRGNSSSESLSSVRS